ncbi:MAG TPA: inorganic phosphate transporter [Prolixibacteraceae bacterium]|nr:inorganic phosphate transporter [Prolixibacteraceae bacterium]HOF54210.1 inorganic phosphate transporter [Prolixibacteraceae bacterium]HOR99178.1 inorganic phosphate transporter [Prolixibacteraceae bacterium]HOS90802.1 inorganic phosphate transporter [Prolixibacteraceae bacterium]HPL44094.1 inorganic phosphate transporter [Prolixibacteraceae bacterium]
MENFYLIIVVVLFALAISDLVVGVTNDAVNFLNSAFGSKAAPKWVIFLLASLGVFIGATFSTGMMEVARKGVFHPDMFVFSEIMILFLAVMITDVILLDSFNALGLPTSTTVSLVFELLGSAVAVSLVKIKSQGGTIADLAHYVNTSNALAIISGILVSIIFAFTFGTLIQYLVRIIFTFNYAKKLRYLGSVFGGIAITMISYFILIKGIDGSSFAAIPVGGEGIPLSVWIGTHKSFLLLLSFVGWTLVLQVLYWLFRIDILTVVVLAGTFALAMAFAGNDLVNFIGVPMAGFSSWKAWSISGGVDPDTFKMDMLMGEVDVPFLFLVIAGIVMIVTLVTSKKAQGVVETGINLSRQSEGVEKFGSSAIARTVVRSSVRMNKKVKNRLPVRFNDFIMRRFKQTEISDDPSAPAFDKIRASVNLMVASSLIALGTSMKLPLSTTYVTFMVAMGTSLADRAWGRESAVYRVSGVLAVIGGWFLTAVIAFTISALVAWLISAGGMPVIIGLILLAIFLVIRTHIIFRRRFRKMPEDEEMINEVDEAGKRIEKCSDQVVKTVISANKIFSFALESFLREDLGHMREAMEMNNLLNAKTKKQKNKIIQTISKMKRVDVDAGYFYIQVIDYQREIAHSLHFLVGPLKEHLENQHKPFNPAQADEIRNLVSSIDEFFNLALHIVKEGKFEGIDDLVSKRMRIGETLYEFEKDQVKRIKEKEVNTRNSLLFFKALTETKNMLIHSVNLIKSYRDFILVNQKPL